MKRGCKRATIRLWPKRKFESIREAARHKDVVKGNSEINAFKRLGLSPAAPHSKMYGR